MSQELVQQKAKTLQALLEISKKQIEAALPKHLTPDRLLRIAMTEARKNPMLLDCTQSSFIGAIIQTAQLGLEPGGALGHSYLVPFKNKRAGTQEVQLIVGYRGMMELAYRSPKVSHVMARAVYEGDKFEYRYGMDEKLDHKPDPDATGKDITHVYAIVFLKEGGKIFDVMERKEINAARSRSKSQDSGPWETDFEAMAKKSVVRRMFKFMPVSIELQQAVGIDEAGDRGEQDNGSIIDTTGFTVFSDKNKTDQFKSAVQGPVSASKSDSPSFEEYSSTGSIVSHPGLDNLDQEHEKSESQLVIEVMEAAQNIGMGLQALSTRCKKDFKKQPKQLTKKELAEFLLCLTNENNERTNLK